MLLKQKTILILSLLASFVISSCAPEVLPQAPEELFLGDGSVVDVRLPYNAGEPKVVTKALSDDSERQVNDLYVILFPVSAKLGPGNFVFDTSKPVYKRYYDQTQLYPAIAEPRHYNAGYVALDNVPTGSYVLVAVANVRTSEYVNSELYSELEEVDSWEDYNQIRASLHTKGSVDRVAPALLMSGTFLPDGSDDSRTDPELITVRTNVGFKGWIHLRRVDAHVKFVISNHIPRCTSFNVYEWQVYNVPSDLLVSNISRSTPTEVANSNAKSIFSVSGDTYTFDFYIPEYIHTSPDLGLDMIRKRAKRTEDDSEWLYAPQDAPYVVFKAKMEMLVDDAETGETDVKRYADARYIIFLGACEGANEAAKAKDFNTDRNYRFTYNVKIKGVEDIVVEAKRTEDTEYNHNVEGAVIDNAGGETIEFDSHYGIANIALSINDLKKMSVILSSVCGTQEYSRDGYGQLISSNLDIESEDFQAFRFSFERESSVEAYKHYPAQSFTSRYVSYSNTYDAGKYLRVLHNERAVSKDETHTYPLYDLQSMLEGVPFSGEFADPAILEHLAEAESYRLSHPGEDQYESMEDIPLVFTMFVNENVYYKDVDNWHHHTNCEDREMRLFTTSEVSTDHRSEYIRGRYNFVQKSCQTYYSDLNDEALCVEFVNEHHHKDLKNTMGARVGAGSSVKSGWTYVNNALSGHEWNEYSDQTTPLCEHYKAFRTHFAVDNVYAKKIPGSTDSNDYEGICASLSRNRDLDRDGIIESNELKWFLASMEQYIQIIIGGAALSSKLFVPDDYYNWDELREGPKGNIFGNVRFHYMGVETSSKIWAEEGYTVGNQSVSGAAQSSNAYNSNPWELRCVRMLVDRSRIFDEEIHWADFDDLYYFSNRSKNVISMDRYRSNLHRQAITGWIDLHPNSDDVSNSTFTHFQFAQADSPLIDRNAGELTLVDRMHTNRYCATYYEADDASDMGTWRVPNQRETAVMRYLAGLSMGTNPNSGAYYLSASIWPFPSSSSRNNNGYNETIDFCTIGANPTKSSPGGQLGTHNMRVRCVRDTDADGNFVGHPEYGNPVEFVAEPEFECVYNDDGTADLVFKSYMTGSLVTSVSASIGDVQSGSVSGVGTDEVTAGLKITPTSTKVTLTWTIQLVNGKTLTYKSVYQLPARYWMISRYGVDYRFATVNQETNLAYVAPQYSGDLDEAPAIDKWIVTKSTSNVKNEENLEPGVTYYFMNAGSETYISGPSSGDASAIRLGGSPLPIKLQLRSGYDGYYVIRLNNSTNANSNGGVGNFGTWNGVDDGSTYKLTPVVIRGEMPMMFRFDDRIITNPDGYSVHITTETNAVPVSVTIDGHQATITGSNGDYTATIVTSEPSAAVISTTWVMSFNGDTVRKTRTYNLPAKCWAIESAKDASRMFAVSSNGVTALPVMSETNVENFPATAKWIVSSSPTEVVNVEEPQYGTVYYLFNIGDDAYIGNPVSWSDQTTMQLDSKSPMKVMFMNPGADGCFALKVYDGNTAKGWINRLSNGFGYWNNSSDKSGDAGNRWRFHPLVKAVPVLNFRFEGKLRQEGDMYVSTATCNPDASLSVLIGGVPATVERNGNSVRAYVSSSSVNGAGLTANWGVTIAGRSYTKIQSMLDSYWAFRDRDNRSKAVTVSGGLSVLRTEGSNNPTVQEDLALPDDCKWLLLIRGDETMTNQTPTLPTNGTYLSQRYILYNFGTGQYLGAPANGTVNSNNFTMVSDPADALEFQLGGNSNGALWKVTINGQTGYFDRRTDWSIGLNGSLRHAWYFKLVRP